MSPHRPNIVVYGKEISNTSTAVLPQLFCLVQEPVNAILEIIAIIMTKILFTGYGVVNDLYDLGI